MFWYGIVWKTCTKPNQTISIHFINYSGSGRVGSAEGNIDNWSNSGQPELELGLSLAIITVDWYTASAYKRVFIYCAFHFWGQGGSFVLTQNICWGRGVFILSHTVWYMNGPMAHNIASLISAGQVGWSREALRTNKQKRKDRACATYRYFLSSRLVENAD